MSTNSTHVSEVPSVIALLEHALSLLRAAQRSARLSGRDERLESLGARADAWVSRRGHVELSARELRIALHCSASDAAAVIAHRVASGRWTPLPTPPRDSSHGRPPSPRYRVLGPGAGPGYSANAIPDITPEELLKQLLERGPGREP